MNSMVDIWHKSPRVVVPVASSPSPVDVFANMPSTSLISVNLTFTFFNDVNQYGHLVFTNFN